jgi:hypothetical protein
MRRLRRTIGGLLYWAPVWVPLLVLCQIATRGLKPALAEAARLESAGMDVEERHTDTRDRFEDLEDLFEALLDPVYRERWLRWRESMGPGYLRPALSSPARTTPRAGEPRIAGPQPRSEGPRQRVGGGDRGPGAGPTPSERRGR